jgi:hypothetical protein
MMHAGRLNTLVSQVLEKSLLAMALTLPNKPSLELKHASEH